MKLITMIKKLEKDTEKLQQNIAAWAVCETDMPPNALENLDQLRRSFIIIKEDLIKRGIKT